MTPRKGEVMLEAVMWLNTKDAAARIGRSPRTLEDCRRTGGGPQYYRTASGRPIYKDKDLDLWLVNRGPFTCIADEKTDSAK